MKIIITEEQLGLLNETYRRDRFDAEYADEYPKFKNMFLKTISKDVKSWGDYSLSIYLMNESGSPLFVYRRPSRTLYYDYSIDREMDEVIPSHIVSRHLKNAVYDYFKGLFPDLEIKEVNGANIV
jgi:hypothetical protein